MRIGVVSASALPSPPGAAAYGGLEAIAAYSAEALAEAHPDTTLFGAKGSRTTRARLFETVDASYEPDLSWPVERSAWEKMRPELERMDVVVDHTHGFWAHLLKPERPGIHVAKVIHDLFPWESSPPSGSTDAVLGVSDFHGQFLQERWGTPVDHIYNGIPTGALTFSEQKEDYLLFLSRLDPGKGAHHFLDIAQKLGGVRAVIAGDDNPMHGINYHYRDGILHRAVSMGVDYRGLVTDREKKDLLAHARAVVVPLADPYMEVFGIWIVEALASGTPVFTTDRGAPREIVTAATGVVAEDHTGLVTPLRRLVAGQDVYPPRDCRARAQEFDVSVMGGNYRRLVRALMDGKAFTH